MSLPFLQLPQSYRACDTTSEGRQLDTAPVPYTGNDPFSSGGETRLSYTYTVPAIQDSNPLYFVCSTPGHCQAGQHISFTVIPPYAELNADESTLDVCDLHAV